jgi:photosystem II stability/assembly factor-like uncharacterized protein
MQVKDPNSHCNSTQLDHLVATRNGVGRLVLADGAWHSASRCFEQRDIRALAAQETCAIAGGKEGVIRSVDGGRHWIEANTGLSIPYIRWLAFHPDIVGLVVAGTEPASIFLSLDAGATWHERPEVARLREAHGWSLPYSPRSGCVRGFACHQQRMYAAVEQGGLLRSDDCGETWRFVDGTCRGPDETPDGKSLHPDVHSVLVHAASPDHVFATTGGGLYGSEDGGATWELLYSCYCRAAWVDPMDPKHIVLGPADGVSRNGRIEESRDGGHSWARTPQPLDTSWPHDMVEHFVTLNDSLLAIRTDGRLFCRIDETAAWESVLPEIPGIRFLV